ncbi:MAG: hypothetical protein ACYC3A_04295 [Halothiobacillus sp.]
MHEPILLALTGIIVAGIAAQWLAWRAKVPVILFLLIIGVFLGPVTGWLQPDLLLGDLLFPFVSLAVAVILFEGSLDIAWTVSAAAPTEPEQAASAADLCTMGEKTLAPGVLVCIMRAL